MTLRTDDWRGLMSELDAIDRRLSELSDSTPDMAEKTILGTMRSRTFGRTLWRAGISLDTISMLMGHESTEQTRRYIGVDMDSMQAAMAMSPL